MITVDIVSRSGKPTVPGGVRVEEDSTVAALQQAIYEAKGRAGKYDPVRQRLTLPPALGEKSGKPLLADKTLAFYGLADGATVQYKDLGMQIKYELVFFLEYFGPMLVYPLFWTGDARGLIYGQFYKHIPPTELAQDMALVYIMFHYAKRILETKLVHKFSHGTMPIANLYRNCGYYWLFAAYISYFINHPLYTPPGTLQTVICFALAYVCQAGNFVSHLILSKLRGRGNSGYQIPRGLLFDYVTCANYTFEIWGWILFSIATQSLPAAIFTLCGALQMVQWALAKHKRLRKLFDGKDGREKYPRRWVIFPPLL